MFSATMAPLVCIAIVAALCFLIHRRRSHRPPDSRVLPGPRGLPFIGSVLQVATSNPWMSFVSWANKYGPIYQVNLGGVNHVWVSDEQIALDLLAKRSCIYSDRPHIPAILADNRTSGHYLPLMSKNDLWRRSLHLTRTTTTSSYHAAFYNYPEIESVRLLQELVATPLEHHEHIESFVARITSRLAWADASASGELKQRARELLISVSPTGHLGNKLPLVMRLPSIVSPSKAWEIKRARTERAWFVEMLSEVRTNIKAGHAEPSWMSYFLTAGCSKETREVVAGDTAGAYVIGMNGIAGALTIAAPMQGVLLALCLHPMYLPKLQEEIDRECPRAPPSYADMPRMPYLRACIRETLRWRPPVPTGIPHELTQDDVYSGYYIPKGSVIHPLEWSMCRDPTKYPRPEAWNPERWLDASSPCYREPLKTYPSILGCSQFGFGKRICPGQRIAEAYLFVGVGAMAWAFDIGRERDIETGLEIPVPELDYSSLLIAKPRPFACRLTLRSEERRKWIEREWERGLNEGMYPPERNFWGENQGRDAEYGWGEVWS